MWRLQTFHFLFLGASLCGYDQLQGLATDEGKAVGSQDGITSEACKTLCDNTAGCESISMCNTQTPDMKSCYLKDKKIVAPSSEPTNPSTCVTVYKNCYQGEIICYQ